MNQATIRTDIPARTIIRRAQEICKANRIKTLLPPVTVMADGLVVVRSIYLPLSGCWLANELLDDLGLGDGQ